MPSRNMRATALSRPLLVERLEQRLPMDTQVSNFVNLNATNPWSDIRELTAVGSQLYFVATEPSGGTLSLWRSAVGSPVERLAGLGPDDRASRQLTNVNGTLFFRGHDTFRGAELWKSDGTPGGTLLVKDLTAGRANSTLASFVSVEHLLYFSANGELMRSDGSAAGTESVRDLFPGQSDHVSDITRVGSTLYFSARGEDPSEQQLYVSDGTVLGTMPVNGANSPDLGNMAAVGNRLFFFKDQCDLWQASQATAERIKSLGRFCNSGDEMTEATGRLFFATGSELWVSDGTSEGTVNLASVGLDIANAFNFNGTLYFSGGERSLNQGDGYELWKSDGTAAGTLMVKDINPDFNEGYSYGSYPSNFTKVQNKLYFLTTLGLWTTDGTEAGTTQVTENATHVLTGLNGQLYFARAAENRGEFTLWNRRSTGAMSELRRTGSGTGSGNPTGIAELDGVIYFSAGNGQVGNELWKRSGSVTTLVKDIVPGSLGSAISHLIHFDGALYFSANHPQLGRGLWKSDGSTAGTQFLARVQPGSSDGRWNFARVGDQIFFSGLSADGQELWKTDGTMAGTVQVADIFPGSTYNYGYGFSVNSSAPRDLLAFRGKLFFTAKAPVSGRELWMSDGTSGGTMLVTDLYPGWIYANDAYSSYPTSLRVRNGKLVFSASAEEGSGLWESDGTASGTRNLLKASDVAGLTTIGEQFDLEGQTYFRGFSFTSGEELWKTDGTATGTQMVLDIRPGRYSSSIRSVVKAEGRLYFTANDGVHGTELWTSDGSADGTQMVADISSGINLTTLLPLDSHPSNLTLLNGVLFFTATNSSLGRELWRTNGSEPGVQLVKDHFLGQASGSPEYLTVINNRLYYSVDTPALGRELWRAFSQSPTISLATERFVFNEGRGPLRLFPSARIVDPDTPVLRGGSAIITILDQVSIDDHLEIVPTVAVTLRNEQVLHNGLLVGTFSGGSSGVPLRIAFNLNAHPTAVRDILRSIVYANPSDNPDLATKAIRLVVTDGEGGRATKSVLIDIQPRNDRPTLVALVDSVTYSNNSPLGVQVAPLAEVQDADSRDFGNGYLSLTVTGGDVDTHRIRLVGTDFTVDALRRVWHAGVVIGTINAGGGLRATPWTVNLNNAATPAIVGALLCAVTFRTVANANPATRSLTISLSDGDGGVTSHTLRISLLPAA